jgi:transcription antitermination factor NusG
LTSRTADRPASSRAFWYVLTIQAQRWRKIIEKLEALDVSVYYPQRTIWRKQRRGPRKRIDMPLIPAYVFVAIDLTARSARSILSIDGIRSFVGVQGVPSVCDDADMSRLRLSVANGDHDETSRIIEQFTVGDVVPIEWHGLAGMHMTIKAIDGKSITGDVMLFGRSNEVTIDIDNIAKHH